MQNELGLSNTLFLNTVKIHQKHYQLFKAHRLFLLSRPIWLPLLLQRQTVKSRESLCAPKTARKYYTRSLVLIGMKNMSVLHCTLQIRGVRCSRKLFQSTVCLFGQLFSALCLRLSYTFSRCGFAAVQSSGVVFFVISTTNMDIIDCGQCGIITYVLLYVFF